MWIDEGEIPPSDFTACRSALATRPSWMRPCLTVDFVAADFLVVVVFAVDFLAVDFLAVDALAGDFLGSVPSDLVFFLPRGGRSLPHPHRAACG